MKKRMRLAAAALLAVMCAVTAFYGCGGTARVSSSQPIAATTINDARWMEDHLDLLRDRKLKQLVLPASHDSAMYLTGFPQSLARTQNLAIQGQLSAGVRWFDLRPQYQDGSFSLFHGPISGPKLADVLGDVRKFMSTGHRELVLLKFSHYDGFSVEAYASFVQRIKQTLGPWLYSSQPAGKRLADLTLGEYLDNTGRILVLCDGHYPIQNQTPGIWIYRDWDSGDPGQGDLRVFDQYSNTMSFSTMKSDQIGKFETFDGNCRNHPEVPCDLFLLSWTLTPPTNVPAFAGEANRQLDDAMKQTKIPNSAGRIVNLLYTDCVDNDLADVAVRMNLRREGTP